MLNVLKGGNKIKTTNKRAKEVCWGLLDHCDFFRSHQPASLPCLLLLPPERMGGFQIWSHNWDDQSTWTVFSSHFSNFTQCLPCMRRAGVYNPASKFSKSTVLSWYIVVNGQWVRQIATINVYIYIHVHQLHNYIEAAKRQSCTFRSTRRGAVTAAAWVVECEEVISSPCESPPFFKNKIGKQWKTVEKRIERSFKTHETVENISYEAHEARQPSRYRPTANLWSLTATHKPAVRPRPPAPELLCRCGRKHQWKSARSMFQLCEVDILLQHTKIQNLNKKHKM